MKLQRLATLLLTALLAAAPATDVGLYRTADAGGSWSLSYAGEWLDWTDGLPPVQVFSFYATPFVPSQVYAVTSRGLWRIDETD